MHVCECKTISGYDIALAYDYSEFTNDIIPTYYKNRSFLTFDIETSTYYRKEQDDYISFMYRFQLCDGENVIFGSKFTEFVDLLEEYRSKWDSKVIVYIHNLAYEFQFMKNYFKFTDVFSLDEHTVLKAVSGDIEFRDSYKLSNMSLEKFTENTPNSYFIKGKGDLDYKKLRFPGDKLTNRENGYCYNDVYCLHKDIEHMLLEDDLNTIAMTSTGFLRRECRKAMRNKSDRNLFKKSILDLETYEMLADGFRGGNTASSRFHTNVILEDVHSYDISSSYPYVMMTYEFPCGKFMKATIDDYETLLKYNKKYCTLARYSFTNLRLKNNREPIPYISHSKCFGISKDALCYNGRVLTASHAEMTLTNVDFDIIDHMYEYDDLYIDGFRFSRKQKLPKSMRKLIMEYFEKKTTLKNVEGQEYFYTKSKNKLNAFFGMCVTAIIREVYQYNPDSFHIYELSKTPEEREKDLEKFNTSWNSFLLYQWGVWITAYARARLQRAIDLVGIDVVYVDTDSVKFIGDHDEVFAAINKEVTALENDMKFHVKHKGKEIYLGVWDKEPGYVRFKTLGAKKYAFEQWHVDKKTKEKELRLGVTVSGLNKENAPAELKAMGGLEEFRNGKVFYNSGRVSAHYVDQNIRHYNIKGHNVEVGSYVSLVDTTYTLGITDTMLSIINACQDD